MKHLIPLVLLLTGCAAAQVNKQYKAHQNGLESERAEVEYEINATANGALISQSTPFIPSEQDMQARYFETKKLYDSNQTAKFENKMKEFREIWIARCELKYKFAYFKGIESERRAYPDRLGKIQERIALELKLNDFQNTYFGEFYALESIYRMTHNEHVENFRKQSLQKLARDHTYRKQALEIERVNAVENAQAHEAAAWQGVSNNLNQMNTQNQMNRIEQNQRNQNSQLQQLKYNQQPKSGILPYNR